MHKLSTHTVGFVIAVCRQDKQEKLSSADFTTPVGIDDYAISESLRSERKKKEIEARNKRARRIVALKVVLFTLDDNNHIPLSCVQEYIKNGLPAPKTYSLADLYTSGLPLMNFYISRYATATGKITYKAVPKMGITERYPSIIVNTEEPLFYRAFTIIATTSIKGTKTEYYWEGNDRLEREVKATFKYFLVVNYAGSYSLLSEQQVVNLGAKGYILTNAAVVVNSIRPIRMKQASVEFPILEYPFSKIELDNHRLMRHQDTLLSSGEAAYEKLIRANRVGNKISSELLVKLRQLADLLNIADIREMLISNNKINARDNESIQALYNRALLWGTLSNLDESFINRKYDDIEAYLADKAKTSSQFAISECSPEENERQEELWSVAYEDMQSTYSSYITQLYNTKIYDRFDKNLKSVYCDALKAELIVSAKLQQYQNQGILSLDGFDYRIKSPASLAEKVYERSRLENKNPQEVIPTLCDVLRYTVVLPCNNNKDTYTEETRNLVGPNGLGGTYSLCKFANYWGSTTNPYRGINTALRVPNNQTIFEVQFHTEASLKLKMGEMHKLYEEQRAPGTSATRYAELTHEMFKLSDSLRVPKDVLGLDVPVTNPLY